MNAPAEFTKLNLRDSKLLRQRCYINGEWQAADSTKTIDVTNPATRCAARHGTQHGRDGNAARDRGGQPSLPRVARQDRKGARHTPAPLVRFDDG